MPQRPMQFGAIAGVVEGQTFDNRREVFNAKLHRSLQAGISGNSKEGCDAIIISGGYEDDDDQGDIIFYTGEGGRNPQTTLQIANQLLVKGNLALDISREKQLPVRVIRGATKGSKWAPNDGYRYDGLYLVRRSWQQKGKSGYTIWRFQLRKIE